MSVGLEVRTRYCYYAMVDGRGAVVTKGRFHTTGEPGPQYDRPRRIDSNGSYLRVKARIGTKIAIIATTRHLAESV